MDNAMNADTHLRRAQVYRFLTDGFLYPQESWLEDLPALYAILEALGFKAPVPPSRAIDLEALQTSYRRSIGLSGSLPYETEIGNPNEFSQSQELADIAGFYRAFGFQAGGVVRERPDFLAMELEFMSLLALKQALAVQEGNAEREEICLQAQRSFLKDHLGRWIGLLAQSLAISIGREAEEQAVEQPYLYLARLAADFVAADANWLGIVLETIPLKRAVPTPYSEDMSCETCPDGLEEDLIGLNL